MKLLPINLGLHKHEKAIAIFAKANQLISMRANLTKEVAADFINRRLSLPKGALRSACFAGQHEYGFATFLQSTEIACFQIVLKRHRPARSIAPVVLPNGFSEQVSDSDSARYQTYLTAFGVLDRERHLQVLGAKTECLADLEEVLLFALGQIFKVLFHNVSFHR